MKAKKKLGQHFLKDKNIAHKIVEAFLPDKSNTVLEIGPGTGMLTQFLKEKGYNFWLIEVDSEAVALLQQKYPELKSQLIHHDFLQLNFPGRFGTNAISIIGNFPYNISSQIMFRVVENREQVELVVGMFQREVARRLTQKPGNKEYGILSVIVQAFYEVEFLFSVNESVFSPPPKVKSGVIRLKRNQRKQLDCDEKLFFKVVKTAFNQRRKTLRNALKPLFVINNQHRWAGKRAEELSVEQFIELTKELENTPNNTGIG